MIKDQTILIKSLSTKADKLHKDIESINGNINATYQNYISALNEVEKVLFECEEYRKKPIEKIRADPCIPEKLNVKMMNSLKAHREALNFYNKFSEAAKVHKAKHELELRNYLSIFEEQEIQRIEVIKLSLIKLLLLEAFTEKNHQYDIEKANIHIQEIDTKKDIEALIHSATVYTPVQKEVTFNCPLKKTGWDRLFELYAKDYYVKGNVPIDYEVIVEETKDYILHEENEEFKQDYVHVKQILYEVIQEGKGISEEAFGNLKTILKNSKGRVAFVDALKDNTQKEAIALNSKEFMKLSELLWILFTYVFE